MEETKELKTDIKRIIPKVEQQHRVWCYYLKKWSNDKKQIWCFDKQTKKSFSSAPENVAKERYAYYQPLLTEDELFCLRRMLKSQNDSVVKDLEIVLFPQKINQLIKTFKIPGLDEDLNYLQSNYLEQYHGFIEQKGKPYLDLFRTIKDVKDFPREQDLYCFNYYLALQYLRTTKANSLIETQRDNNECQSFVFDDGKKRTIRLWVVTYYTVYVLATKLAQTLSYNNYKYHIFDCKEAQLLTSDQPVYNSCKSLEIINGVPFSKEMTILHPLSPTRVLLIDKEGENSVDNVENEQIEEINQLTTEMSNRFVFASSEQQIKSLSSHF